jgi:signal transduction histidine kinase
MRSVPLSPSPWQPARDTERGIRASAVARWRSAHQDRWVALFLLARGLATAAAVALLVAHRVTDHDVSLLVGAVAAGPGAMLLVATSPRVSRSALAWGADAAIALSLVVASEDWRSPFYLLALTTLILPAVALNLRAAAAWGAAFVAAYLAVAAFTGLGSRTLDSTIRLETLATHLLVPLLVVLALSYASDLLVRLRREEERARHLALETERRRIAWDLHDSAKQRVHAAHLMISAIDPARAGAEPVDQALRELQAAIADMDTSVGELQIPLDGRRLLDVVGERAAEMAPLTRARITISGEAPELPPTLTVHAYRIVTEALLNAVRHADATAIGVVLAHRDDCLSIRVTDDGAGMNGGARPGSHGLRFMSHRAATIGARLHFATGEDGRGTSVLLDIPTPKEITP